jgi:Tetratricopeptide repeat
LPRILHDRQVRLRSIELAGYSPQIAEDAISRGRKDASDRCSRIMPKSTYLTCLWPGLARVWWAGDWRALFVAFLFAALLNSLAYLSVFPEYGVGETYLMFGWVAAISWWGASAHSALSELPFLLGMAVKLSKPGDLAEAQVAYLKRNFVATESIIGKILTTEPGDPAPRLLLAATYRQTGRISEARGLLSSLQREPAAFAWQFEIEADLARLERLEKTPLPEVSSSPEVESKPRVVKAPSADEPSSTVARRAASRKAA